MSACLVKREPDQSRLKSLDLTIEINPFGETEGAQPVRLVPERLVPRERFCLSE